MARQYSTMIGDLSLHSAGRFTMPLTFVYLIGIALSAVLALVAPHYRGLCFVMTAIFSLQIVPVGLLEAFTSPRER